MTRHLQYEGPELEELLDHVNQRHGAGVKIIKADKAREGGIAGFFAREVFHVVVSVEDEADPTRGEDETSLAGTGGGRRSVTDADGDEALWSIVAAGATSAATEESGAEFAATLGKLLSENPPAPSASKRAPAVVPVVPVVSAVRDLPVVTAVSATAAISAVSTVSNVPVVPAFPVVSVAPQVPSNAQPASAAVPVAAAAAAAIPPPVPPPIPSVRAIRPPLPRAADPTIPAAPTGPTIPTVSMPALENDSLCPATPGASAVFPHSVFPLAGFRDTESNTSEGNVDEPKPGPRIKLSTPTQSSSDHSTHGRIVELSNRRIQRQVVGSMSFDELLGAFETAQLGAPELPRSGVVAVVGSLVEAEPLASMMAECAGGLPSDILVVSPGDETELPTPAEIMGLAAQLRRRRGTSVVVIELLPGLSGHMWATQVLAHLSATQVRYVVGGGRTADGTTIALQALGRVDVIDLVDVHDIAEPERFLELGTPVGSLDSRTPTPALWAAASVASRVVKETHATKGKGDLGVINPTARRAE